MTGTEDPYAEWRKDMLSPTEYIHQMNERVATFRRDKRRVGPDDAFLLDPECDHTRQIEMRKVFLLAMNDIGLFTLEMNGAHPQWINAETVGQGGGKGALGVRTLPHPQFAERVTVMWYTNDGRIEVPNPTRPGAQIILERIACTFEPWTSGYREKVGGKYSRNKLPRMIANITKKAGEGRLRPKPQQQAAVKKPKYLVTDEDVTAQHALMATSRFCGNCGAPGGSKFCTSCGSPA